MTCCAGPITGDVALANAEALSLQRLSELRAAGKTMPDGTVQYSLSVPAVHCGQCISTIEAALRGVPGVKSARVNLALRRAAFTLDSSLVSPMAAVSAIEGQGYAVFVLDDLAERHADREFSNLVKALAVAGFAAANVMLLSVSVWTGAEGAARDMFHFISALIAIPAVGYAGQPFFRSAYKALRSGRMNMDVPISLGVLLALLMSIHESFTGGAHAYFDAAVTLLFFLLIGRTLDHMMRERAREAVTSLGRLSAKGALRISPDRSLEYIRLDEIIPGMELRVPAGERIPVDCRVKDGRSDIDKSLVTGESAAVHVSESDEVEAGTLNLTGPLDVVALRAAGQSFLADVQRMMEAAEHGRGLYVRLADRVARMYAPAVHVLALASFLGWMIATAGGWHQSLTVAVSVLIITCPCALGLAVPVAHVVSASRLFRSGILMKDGSALERLAEIDGVVFDKTGTLTTGQPQVVNCTIPSGSLTGIAKALAERSSHPASRALSAYLQGVAADVSAATEIPGQGIEALCGGRNARLGRPSWVGEIARQPLETAAGRLAFAVKGGEMFMVELHEELRQGAREVSTTLRSAGLETEILSGDAPSAVARVAEETGIIHYRAALKPGDKLARLQAAKLEGQKLLMVGDGLNDAPALSAAHVSMAPASAAEVGRMAADFVFTRPSLAAVTIAYGIARDARRVVFQNFGLAIVYNLFAVPLAMSGYLSPFIAAIAMSSSSIIVVANSLRLYGGREHQQPKPRAAEFAAPLAPLTAGE